MLLFTNTMARSSDIFHYNIDFSLDKEFIFTIPVNNYVQIYTAHVFKCVINMH